MALDWPAVPIHFTKIHEMGLVTLPIHTHFNWYRTYQTSCNRAGFMAWLIQELFKTTNYRKQPRWLQSCYFGRLLLMPVWLFLCQRYMLYFSHWLYACPMASRGGFFCIGWYCLLEINVEFRGTRLGLEEERNMDE